MSFTRLRSEDRPPLPAVEDVHASDGLKIARALVFIGQCFLYHADMLRAVWDLQQAQTADEDEAAKIKRIIEQDR